MVKTKNNQKSVAYIGGQAINLQDYTRLMQKKETIRKKVLELQEIKTEVRIKAQELSKLHAEFFGLPYKKNEP